MIWQVAAGLILLLGGGEMLVRGAVEVAGRLKMSPLVIGVVLLGFGTSAPELATCVDAALKGSPGIAIGNIVGSNIANVLLILAIGALLRPIVCAPKAFKRDGPVIALSAIVCTVIVIGGSATRTMGAVLLLILIGYLIWTALSDRRQITGENAAEKPDQAGSAPPLAIDLTLVALGLGAILYGADLLVVGAVDLAGRLGVSETSIGLTVVAIGTSLPELATTVVAAFRRQGDVAFGNIIGSNIFNSFGILGATALVQPIVIPPEVAAFDIWVMLGATAALLVFAITRWRISRWEGGALLAGYVIYLGTLAVSI